MLRDPTLVPLSHQHQHALALCVRIQRGVTAADADSALHFQDEISAFASNELFDHFETEELYIFPAARDLPELTSLVEDLLQEHTLLRSQVQQAAAHTMTAEHVIGFANTLSAHIRKEERHLFEDLQRRLSSEQLRILGAQINRHIQSGSSGTSCRVRRV